MKRRRQFAKISIGTDLFFPDDEGVAALQEPIEDRGGNEIAAESMQDSAPLRLVIATLSSVTLLPRARAVPLVLVMTSAFQTGRVPNRSLDCGQSRQLRRRSARSRRERP